MLGAALAAECPGIGRGQLPSSSTCRHELKLVPDAAVAHLAALFSKATQLGMPPSLLVTRVRVPAKVAEPQAASQSRPIVVFRVLYRVWSSLIARQSLRHCASFFPESLVGSMPARSCRSLSLRQQAQIESALLDKRDLMGCSFDIVKCFNQLGWRPSEAMLVNVGLPSSIAACWRHLGKPSSFWNGAPEGDPLSVVVMCAVCYHHHMALRSYEVQHDSFVDNWSWMSPDAEELQRALSVSVRFLEGLRLPVDWNKSYCWAMARRLRAAWHQVARSITPDGIALRLVADAKNLGVCFQYDQRVRPLARARRFPEGRARLQRLKEQPRPLLEKARLIQMGVWSQCLYGLEGHLPSVAELKTLRSAASHALIGNNSSASPYLALATLSTALVDPQLYCLGAQLPALRALWEFDLGVANTVQQLASAETLPRRTSNL